MIAPLFSVPASSQRIQGNAVIRAQFNVAYLTAFQLVIRKNKFLKIFVYSTFKITPKI